VPSPYLKKGELSDEAIRGKAVFEKVNCGLCHSGPYYTDLKTYKMGDLGKYDKQNSWDTPTLIELWRTGPYMHNGEFANIEDVFKVGMHGLENALTENEINDLSAFLLSL
jgi:cytochrome c peroxidase